MRNHYIISVFALFALFLIAPGCGVDTPKTDKEKAVLLAKLTYEAVKDGRIDMRAPDNEVEKQLEEIAIEAGFKNFDEADEVMEKYEDDPEVKEWLDKIYEIQ
jgi:hypothetical protein